MAEAKDTASFGALLRRHRLARGLPQEALAERAGLGTRSIQDLERGINQPRRETLQRLIEALALPREEEAQLEAAAQPRPRRRKGALVTAPTAAGGSPWPGEATPRSPLPVPLTSFVGRERELAEIKELLQTTRLVTLTGAGGCGKTRLALQIAADRAGAGVALVELAALVDPTRVPPTIAERLGVREMPPTPLATTLVAALREKNLFLVLDNCEHLVEACADIVDTLLRGCSGLQVLATSREPLGIVGEVCWRVPSLAAPNPAGHLPAGAAERFDAIRLFVARARATRPGFAFSDANALSVARICWQLDGIPLAIELAAARLNLFTPSQIAERLGDRFRLLTGGGRTAPARQRTLRAAIDWSYELLTDAARALFRRLAVFGGGFDLDAAEVVCSDEAGLISRGDVLPHLVQVVDKSLVVVEEHGERARYRYLETIRAYALERLVESGEEATVRQRHARHFLALAEDAEPKLEGSDGQIALARLDREIDNFRAAIGTLRDTGAAEAGLRLAAALRFYWYRTGRFAEGRELTVGLLALDSPVTPQIRIRALNGLGFLAEFQGDWAAARSFAAEALAIARPLGDRQAIADALTNLGNIGVSAGEGASARAICEEGLQINRALGHQQGIADGLINLGRIAQSQGDFASARRLIGEALAIWRALSDEVGIEWALSQLALVALEGGRYAEARPPLVEGLTLCDAIGEKWGICVALEGFGWLAAAADQLERALQLAGAAAALSEAWGIVGGPGRQGALARWLPSAREALGAEAGRAWAAGRAMTKEQAVAFALDGNRDLMTEEWAPGED